MGTRLLMEVNNGRLAMLGLLSFLSEARVPGSVPALKGLILPYAGEVMAPFQPAVMAVNAEYTVDDLAAQAVALNPKVGFWDPLGLSKQEFWGQSIEATIEHVIVAFMRLAKCVIFWSLALRPAF